MTVEIKVNPTKDKCIRCGKDNSIGYIVSISFVVHIEYTREYTKELALELLKLCSKKHG